MCISEKQLLALSLVLCNDIKADYPQPFLVAAVPEPLHPWELGQKMTNSHFQGFLWGWWLPVLLLDSLTLPVLVLAGMSAKAVSWICDQWEGKKYQEEMNLNSSRYWQLPCVLRWWSNLFFTNSSYTKFECWYFCFWTRSFISTGFALQVIPETKLFPLKSQQVVLWVWRWLLEGTTNFLQVLPFAEQSKSLFGN